MTVHMTKPQGEGNPELPPTASRRRARLAGDTEEGIHRNPASLQSAPFCFEFAQPARRRRWSVTASRHRSTLASKRRRTEEDSLHAARPRIRRTSSKRQVINAHLHLVKKKSTRGLRPTAARDTIERKPPKALTPCRRIPAGSPAMM